MFEVDSFVGWWGCTLCQSSGDERHSLRYLDCSSNLIFITFVLRSYNYINGSTGALESGRGREQDGVGGKQYSVTAGLSGDNG